MSAKRWATFLSIFATLAMIFGMLAFVLPTEAAPLAWRKDSGASCELVFARIKNDQHDGVTNYQQGRIKANGSTVATSSGEVDYGDWAEVSWNPPAGFSGTVVVELEIGHYWWVFWKVDDDIKIVKHLDCEPEHVEVTLCHATPPDTAANGYQQITTDDDGALGHAAQHSADIIPPFSYYGGSFPGLNWDSEGQAIFNNDCVPPEPPSGDIVSSHHENECSPNGREWVLDFESETDNLGEGTTYMLVIIDGNTYGPYNGDGPHQLVLNLSGGTHAGDIELWYDPSGGDDDVLLDAARGHFNVSDCHDYSAELEVENTCSGVLVTAIIKDFGDQVGDEVLDEYSWQDPFDPDESFGPEDYEVELPDGSTVNLHLDKIHEPVEDCPVLQKLKLTSFCTPLDHWPDERYWRIRNPNDQPVEYTLVLVDVDGNPTVSGTAQPGDNFIYTTANHNTANTTKLMVNGNQHDVKASQNQLCTSPASVSIEVGLCSWDGEVSLTPVSVSISGGVTVTINGPGGPYVLTSSDSLNLGPGSYSWSASTEEGYEIEGPSSGEFETISCKPPGDFSISTELACGDEQNTVLFRTTILASEDASAELSTLWYYPNGDPFVSGESSLGIVNLNAGENVFESEMTLEELKEAIGNNNLSGGNPANDVDYDKLELYSYDVQLYFKEQDSVVSNQAPLWRTDCGGGGRPKKPTCPTCGPPVWETAGEGMAWVYYSNIPCTICWDEEDVEWEIKLHTLVRIWSKIEFVLEYPAHVYHEPEVVQGVDGNTWYVLQVDKHTAFNSIIWGPDGHGDRFRDHGKVRKYLACSVSPGYYDAPDGIAIYKGGHTVANWVTFLLNEEFFPRTYQGAEEAYDWAYQLREEGSLPLPEK